MNKFFLKVFLLALPVLLYTVNAFSQSNFYFGYNLGTFTMAQRYFQIIDYEYQVAYGYTEKGFRLSPLLHGFSYGYRLNFSDAFGMSVNHYRKVARSNVAEFPQDYLAQYKMILKSWGVGFVFREDYPKIGIDYEFGRMTLKKKKYPADEFKSSKWVDYCPTINLLGKGPIFMGLTFYTLHRWKFLEFRPYLSWIPGVTEYPDYTDGISRYTFRISSVGIHVFYVFGRKD